MVSTFTIDFPQVQLGLSPEHPKAQGYNALVDDTWVRTAPNREQPIRYYTRDSLAPRTDDRGSTYENVLDLGYAWARGDVSGGEGLDFDPRLIARLTETEALDVIRFWDSMNLDITRPSKGEVFKTRLSREFEAWAQGGSTIDLAVSDNFIAKASGDEVSLYASWEALTEFASYTFLNPGEAATKVVFNPTNELAILTDDGSSLRLYVWDVQADPTPLEITGTLPGEDIIDIWYAKGRFLLITDSGALHEFSPTTIDTIPFDTTTGTCYSIVESGPAIVGAFSDGTVRSYVPEQSNQLDPASVRLVIRGRTDVPQGEVPYLLGANAGVLLIFTRTANADGSLADVRLYQATVLDARFDYVVGQLQLIREWEDVIESADPRLNVAASRDEMWFAIDEFANETSVWRFDLVTSGLSRHSMLGDEFSNREGGKSIVFYDERIGLVAQGDTYVESLTLYKDEGYLISPLITFGLNTPINWIATSLSADIPNPGGRQVELWYSTNREAILDPNHPSWKLQTRLSGPTRDAVVKQIVGVQSSQAALKIVVLSSQNKTKTPNVNSFALRGLPAQRDWILELPVNVSDYIEVPHRRPLHIPGYGNIIHSAMLSKVGDSLEVEVLDPPMLFRGIVDNVIEPTEYVSDRGSVSVRCVLQLRGERLKVTAEATGDAGLGLGLLGVSTLGVGQTERT